MRKRGVSRKRGVVETRINRWAWSGEMGVARLKWRRVEEMGVVITGPGGRGPGEVGVAQVCPIVVGVAQERWACPAEHSQVLWAWPGRACPG